jgi:hypothetical protein
MCYSKRRFPDQVTAFLQINRIKSKYQNAACTDLRPYECPVCRGWHLSKIPIKPPMSAEEQKQKWLDGQIIA